MLAPQIPSNEEERLNDLRTLSILDTKPEERFDRVTRMAKRIFDVPIALVSLVDANRQWFKSCVGLDASETSRDISFCGHAILGDKVFVINDATQDDRFSDNPLVTDDPNIRFYAGCPLKMANGNKLGTLCIIDQKPRAFSQNDIDTLVDLAAMVESELAALQLATVDELTQLCNRRGFMLLGQHNLNISRRQKKATTLTFIDLNNFKSINDKYGHDAGDQALVQFSSLMKETLRDSDLYARLGGDEFVVLSTDASREKSELIITRLAAKIKAFNQQTRHAFKLEFAYGIVEFNRDKHSDIEALLKEADGKMYRHKQGTKAS